MMRRYYAVYERKIDDNLHSTWRKFVEYVYGTQKNAEDYAYALTFSKGISHDVIEQQYTSDVTNKAKVL